MFNRNWLLAALVGMVLICESTALLCLECADTDTDTACSLGTGTPTPCTSPQETSCYLRNNDGKIERGCLTDLTATDPGECKTTGAKCVSCTGDSCNNDPWLKCHECDGETAECTGAQAAATGAALCPLFAKADQCFAKADGNKVTRGCKSSLPAGDDGCTDNEFCDYCNGNACNSMSGESLKVYTKCLMCKSQDGAKCEDGTAAAALCPNREDTCYSRVQDKVLERGCLSQLPEADQAKCKNEADSTCVTCSSEEGCNKQKWLKCHQCKEADTPKCAEEQTVDEAEFCKTHRETYNKCYERLENDKMVRGCENDLTTIGNACTGNSDCRTCQTNGCNREKASTLKTEDRCLQCTTSKDEDSTCLLGTASSTPCVKASEKKCYSKTDKDGVLTRGCFGDLTADEGLACTDKTCATCVNEGCNGKVFPTDRLRCYQCTTTDSDKTCSNQLTGEAKSSYCTLYKDGDKCYSRISEGVFERGCQSNLKAADPCDGLTAKQCLTCAGENCNGISEERLKNSAGQKAISSILVAAIVAFVVLK